MTLFIDKSSGKFHHSHTFFVPLAIVEIVEIEGTVTGYISKQYELWTFVVKQTLTATNVRNNVKLNYR